MLASLARLGYHQMTPIQAASLPVALAGNDLIAQAKTGGGKTAAFGLPCCSASTRATLRCRRWCCARPANSPTGE